MPPHRRAVLVLAACLFAAPVAASTLTIDSELDYGDIFFGLRPG
jgi:hypothetical protein